MEDPLGEHFRWFFLPEEKQGLQKRIEISDLVLLKDLKQRREMEHLQIRVCFIDQ
jgi:hypothetical protein